MNRQSKLKTGGRSWRVRFDACRLALGDPRTPRLPKLLLAAAIGYALLPFDLIPDFIPVLGLVDDAIVVPALIWLAVRLIPRGVMDDCLAEAARRRAAPAGQQAHKT